MLQPLLHLHKMIMHKTENEFVSSSITVKNLHKNDVVRVQASISMFIHEFLI